MVKWPKAYHPVRNIMRKKDKIGSFASIVQEYKLLQTATNTERIF